MKKYITPDMTVRIFSDSTDVIETASVADPNEVPGLKDIPAENKTQVKLSEMAAITKFTF